MRSGMLDTGKIAEAFQGVPTVYMREGQVKSDRISVCILIDESGSMYGEGETAARDTAVLLNEAIGTLQNVDLYIYGHSTDGGTALYVAEATESIQRNLPVLRYREMGVEMQTLSDFFGTDFKDMDEAMILVRENNDNDDGRVWVNKDEFAD